jgi:hypothetical protein
MSPQPGTPCFDIITIPPLYRDTGMVIIGLWGVISSNRSHLTMTTLRLSRKKRNKRRKYPLRRRIIPRRNNYSGISGRTRLSER